MGNNESTTKKHAGDSLAILIAMRVRRYDAGRIAQWITSGASWVGSSPAAGATATDAAMPLSPPTDDGDDQDEGEGRRDEWGGGGRQGSRAVGGRRKASEWRVMKARRDGGGRRRTEVRGEEAAASLKIRQSRASKF
jgi:hypothetical protein